MVSTAAPRIDYFWVLDESPLCAILHDPLTGNVVWANQAAANAHGYAQLEMLGLPLEALMTSSAEFSPNRALEKITGAMRNGREMAQWRVRHRNGREMPIEAVAMVVRDAAKRELVLVQFRDTSVEYDALRREERLRRLLTDSFGGTMIVDIDGIVRYVAPSITRMLGYREDRFTGSNIRRIQHPGDRRRIRTFVRALAPDDNALKHIEYRIRHADGSFRYHEASLRNLRFDPDVGGILVSFRDVTDRVEAELDAKRRRDEVEYLARYHTMAELGSAIAHELNQPVSAIRNYAAGCLTTLDDAKGIAASKWAVTQIKGEAERASRIMRSIRNFTARGREERRSTPVIEILAEIDAFLQLKAGESSSQLLIDIEPKDLSVWCDKTLIGQVLLNLALNGFQAMSDIPMNHRLLKIAARAANRGFVEMIVTDTGHGMNTEQLATLFESRNSSKEMGFGLGLILSRSIIVKHGGTMFAKSVLAQGTSMHLTLRRRRQRGLAVSA